MWPILAHAEFAGKVVGVLDGDSIRVMHEGKAEQIRLAGIDCPERRQAFGAKAKQATSTLSFGKVVTVEAVTKDRYWRTVARATLPNGVLLKEELVRQGMCWWYRKYAPHDERLKELEETARREKRGLWVEANPVPRRSLEPKRNTKGEVVQCHRFRRGTNRGRVYAPKVGYSANSNFAMITALRST